MASHPRYRDVSWWKIVMYLHNSVRKTVRAHRPVPFRRYPFVLRRSSMDRGSFQGLGMPAAELARKLKFLSLLPHKVESGGKDVALTPAVVDPKIYDGLERFNI